MAILTSTPALKCRSNSSPPISRLVSPAREEPSMPMSMIPSAPSSPEETLNGGPPGSRSADVFRDVMVTPTLARSPAPPMSPRGARANETRSCAAGSSHRAKPGWLEWPVAQISVMSPAPASSTQQAHAGAVKSFLSAKKRRAMSISLASSSSRYVTARPFGSARWRPVARCEASPGVASRSHGANEVREQAAHTVH